MKDFLPYFAGYIDGDGHFRFKKYIQDGHTCYTCKIMITSTAEEPLIYFRDNVGGAYYKKAHINTNWKPEFIYTLHVGKEKFEQIRDIGKFLIEKRSQFNLIERFMNESKEGRDIIIQQAKQERIDNANNRQDFERIKSIKNSIIPIERDFIYLAGYIDAEGCLTVTKKTLKTGSLSFSCHMRAGVTKFPCIEFLFTRFGGCISYKKASKNQSFDCLEWEITDKSLEAILPKIYPHLIIKQRQCENIISLRRTYESKMFPRDKHFYSYYNQVTPTRELIFNTVKSLNKRGIQAD